MKRTVRSEHQVTIHMPADQIFAALSDVRNTAKWHPSTVEEYFTSEPPVGIGSTRKSIGKAFGMTVETEAEVTVYQPNKALGLNSLDSPVPYEISITITPVKDGTRVTWIEELRPSGLFRLVTRLTAGVHRRQTRTGLRRLKQMLEDRSL